VGVHGAGAARAAAARPAWCGLDWAPSSVSKAQTALFPLT